MEKILVNVSVPAAEKSFDVFIPDDINVKDATAMLGKALSALSDNKFLPSEDCMIFEADTGKSYDDEALIKDLPIYDGTKLMLI